MKRTVQSLLAVLATATMAYAAATVKPGNLTRVDTSSSAGAVDATLSSEAHASYPAAGAFDGKMATTADRWLSKKAAHMSVVYHFNEATRVNTIMLYSSASDMYDTRSPKNWTFEGSNNGEDWTILDTRTDESSWGKGEIRTYRFENDTAYAYYKFDCTAINGASDYLMLWEIEFYTSDATLPTKVSIGGAGTIPSSSSSHSSYPGSKAFDGNHFTGDYRWLANVADHMYVVYHFKRAHIVNAVGIFNGGGWDGANRAPKDWTISGSSDGETWTVLDTQTDETNWAFNSSTNKGEERYYAFDNSTAFEYYKFDCTAVNGATDYLQILEIEYYGVELPPPTLDEKVAMFLASKGYTNVLDVALDSIDHHSTFFSRNSDGYSDFIAASQYPGSKVAFVYKVNASGKWWFAHQLYYDSDSSDRWYWFVSNTASYYENLEVFRLSDGGKQANNSPYNEDEYFVAIYDLPDLVNHTRIRAENFANTPEFHIYVLHPTGRISYALRRVDALPSTLELGQTATFSVMPYDEVTGTDLPDLPVVYQTNSNVSYSNGIVRALATGTGSVAGVLTVGETIVSNKMTTTIPMLSTNSYMQAGSWEIDKVNSGNNWAISFPVSQLEGLRTSMNHDMAIVKIEYDNPSAAAINSGVNLVLNGKTYALASWTAHAAGSQEVKWIAFADAIPEITTLNFSVAPGIHFGRVTVYKYVSGTFLIFK